MACQFSIFVQYLSASFSAVCLEFAVPSRFSRVRERLSLLSAFFWSLRAFNSSIEIVIFVEFLSASFKAEPIEFTERERAVIIEIAIINLCQKFVRVIGLFKFFAQVNCFAVSLACNSLSIPSFIASQNFAEINPTEIIVYSIAACIGTVPI